ncbi:MFS transporter, partial [Arthrobacter agilis]
RGEGELSVWVLPAAACLVLAGIADSVSSVFRNTILQSATPDAMRGRLQGVFIVVVAGGPRLGDMVAGGQAAWLGEGWTAVVGGVACIVLVLAVARWQPRFARYDSRRPEA